MSLFVINHQKRKSKLFFISAPKINFNSRVLGSYYVFFLSKEHQNNNHEQVIYLKKNVYFL